MGSKSKCQTTRQLGSLDDVHLLNLTLAMMMLEERCREAGDLEAPKPRSTSSTHVRKVAT
jgi:hypothetical protein